jgi:hypothetical protein
MRARSVPSGAHSGEICPIFPDDPHYQVYLPITVPISLTTHTMSSSLVESTLGYSIKQLAERAP